MGETFVTLVRDEFIKKIAKGGGNGQEKNQDPQAVPLKLTR
jgi:hypothetical protein